MDICFACGFNSVSYFGRVFKQIKSTNPSQFGRILRKHNSTVWVLGILMVILIQQPLRH